MDLYHYMFKYIIVGDSNAGKSCLLLDFTENRFSEHHEPTIGVEFGAQMIFLGEMKIKIQVWDTAGQDSFKSVARSYYKGSIGVILVFDVTNRLSFSNISKWYTDVMDCTHEMVEITLVGNKTDLEEYRVVTFEEAKLFAEQFGMQYIETSAKYSQNVEAVFEGTAKRIYQKLDKFTNENENYGVKCGVLLNGQNSEQSTISLQEKHSQGKNGCC